MQTVGHWINGEVAPARQDARFGDVYNPAIGKVVTSRWLDPSHAGLQLGFPTNV